MSNEDKDFIYGIEDGVRTCPHCGNHTLFKLKKVQLLSDDNGELITCSYVMCPVCKRRGPLAEHTTGTKQSKGIPSFIAVELWNRESLSIISNLKDERPKMYEAAKGRKVRAIKWTGHNLDRVNRFCSYLGIVSIGSKLMISTHYGNMSAVVGDYIVQLRPDAEPTARNSVMVMRPCDFENVFALMKEFEDVFALMKDDDCEENNCEKNFEENNCEKNLAEENKDGSETSTKTM